MLYILLVLLLLLYIYIILTICIKYSLFAFSWFLLNLGVVNILRWLTLQGSGATPKSAGFAGEIGGGWMILRLFCWNHTYWSYTVWCCFSCLCLMCEICCLVAMLKTCEKYASWGRARATQSTPVRFQAAAELSQDEAGQTVVESLRGTRTICSICWIEMYADVWNAERYACRWMRCWNPSVKDPFMDRCYQTFGFDIFRDDSICFEPWDAVGGCWAVCRAVICDLWKCIQYIFKWDMNKLNLGDLLVFLCYCFGRSNLCAQQKPLRPGKFKSFSSFQPRHIFANFWCRMWLEETQSQNCILCFFYMCVFGAQLS